MLVLDSSSKYILLPIENVESNINSHVYLNVLNTPNQVFVRHVCANEVPFELTKLVLEENSKIMDNSFWSKQRIIETE